MKKREKWRRGRQINVFLEMLKWESEFLFSDPKDELCKYTHKEGCSSFTEMINVDCSF